MSEFAKNAINAFNQQQMGRAQQDLRETQRDGAEDELRLVYSGEDTERLRRQFEQKQQEERQGLYREVARLKEENRVYQECLERAENLARTKILQTEGFAATISHLYKAWNSPENAPGGLPGAKEVEELIDKKILEAAENPDILAKTDATIEKVVRPEGKRPRRSPR